MTLDELSYLILILIESDLLESKVKASGCIEKDKVKLKLSEGVILLSTVVRFSKSLHLIRV